MNGFEQHNITHLSPSSINLWINAPDVWVAEKLFGKRGQPSAAMHRGITVEAATVAVLMGEMGIDEAVSAYTASMFDAKFLIGDERTAKQRDLIGPMVRQAVDALKPYGKPSIPDTDRGQHKITLTCNGDGWELPFIGFLDFDYADAGVVIDLKTTERLPSKMTAEHQVQRCIYAKAKGNAQVSFLYVTPKKTALLSDGNVAETLARVKLHASRLERLLRDRSKEEIAALVHCCDTSFYWNGNEQARAEIYGV